MFREYGMEEFKSFFKKLKWDSIIISLLTIILGIVCVVIPNESGNVLTLIFGISLIIMGVCLIIRLFTVDTFLTEHILLLSILMIILGIFVLIFPETIKSLMTVLFGMFIVLDSVSSLSDSIYLCKAEIRGWTVLFVLSLITIILGVSVMFSSFETVMIFAGCSLIIEGVRKFVTTLIYSRKIKVAKKQLKESGLI